MPKKVLIIGGVAAGASAAARLRRLEENTGIIVLERGENISFANCGLPYYVGNTIREKESLLLHTPDSMRARFNLDVRVRHEVTKIEPSKKTVSVRNILTGENYYEGYDYLLLCPGASPVIPKLPGVDLPGVYTLRTIPDSEIIRQHIMTNRPAHGVIVGGGFIGLEVAEMMHAQGVTVHLLEATNQVMPPLDFDMAAFTHRHLIEKRVDLLLAESLASFEGTGNVERAVLSSGKKIPAGIAVLGIGVRPETGLARDAGITIGPSGGIAVDASMRTSDPYIYAAGDAVEVIDIVTGVGMLLPMAGPANRQGWIAANSIAGRHVPYKGVQGTAVVKVFDMTAACTGKNEKSLKKAGIAYRVVHVHPNSHASYYPGATPLCVKLIFTPDRGKLLGAQIVGYNGVDKRIDVLATALRAGMNVFDLQDLELAYAPPYSSAKDPVNMAGYAAGNIVNGTVETIEWADVPDKMSKGAYLVDVRTPMEVRMTGTYTGAHHLPVDEIRDRMTELPRDREVLLYCQAGLRSYVAYRILVQNGYKAKSINGGYRLYDMIAD